MEPCETVHAFPSTTHDEGSVGLKLAISKASNPKFGTVDSPSVSNWACSVWDACPVLDVALLVPCESISVASSTRESGTELEGGGD